MNKLFSLVFIAAGIVMIGSFVIYAVESGNENSQINSYLDALWWSVATITTVGYGDTIPVTETGKVIAMIYMFSGISILTIGISIMGTIFYKKRFEGEQKEISHAQKLILNRLDDLEKNQEKLQKDLKELIEHVRNTLNPNGSQVKI